ncbi:MAG: ribosome silencing factor [Gammaproteobacteria bacterium]
MQTDELLKIVQDVLDEHKGHNITTIDVSDKTTVTDYMVLATGTSDRHIKALADYVTEKVKENGFQPLGQEGGLGSDWVLLDLGDIILHLMTDQARNFYQLEKLWSVEQKSEALNALQD